ncbi:MAG TPA: PAC2 family protein [Candidatus Acidoferrales bacterium]|nr:PAC2 family protein [Candidatus Acidoferrales bacterium]
MSNGHSESDELRIVENDSIGKDSVVINGLPDVGLVGLLAASHIISSLKLKEVGAIESERLPPMIVLHGGLPRAPIRIFSGNDLAVVISETVIPSSLIRPLANQLTNWAHEKRVKLMLSLGGMAVGNRQDIETPKVFAAISSKELESKLGNAAEILEEGYIVGAYGLLLRRCAQLSVPAITLLTQSHYNYPDPEAAAASLNAVNKILNLKLDVSDLIKRGEEIRLRSKDMMHRTHEEMTRMDKSHEYDLPPLYG